MKSGTVDCAQGLDLSCRATRRLGMLGIDPELDMDKVLESQTKPTVKQSRVGADLSQRWR